MNESIVKQEQSIPFAVLIYKMKVALQSLNILFSFVSKTSIRVPEQPLRTQAKHKTTLKRLDHLKHFNPFRQTKSTSSHLIQNQ